MPNAIDFFGPGLGVYVLTPNQLQNPSVVLAVDSDFLDASVNLTPLVTSVDLRIGIGSYMQGEIVISPPFEIAMKLVESRLMDYGNVMIVQFGYAETGHVSPPFALFVNNYPDVQLDPSRSTITFKVQGFFSNSSRKCTDISWDFNAYAPEYALGVIREIARRHEVEVQFTTKQEVNFASATGVPGNPASSTRTLTSSVGPLPPDIAAAAPPGLTNPDLWAGKFIDQVNGENDWDFLHRILAVANVALQIDDKKVLILDKQAALSSTPVYTFRMFGDVDTSSGIFPIVNFEIRGSWWFQHPEVVALETREGMDPSSKTTAPARPYDALTDPLIAFLGDTTAATKSALPTKVLVFPDGSRTRIAVSYGTRESGCKFFTSSRDPFKTRAEARARDGTMDTSGFKGTLRTFGLPYIAPMTIVAVEGVGRFAGRYQVESIQHHIDAGGFFTSLRIRRNTVADGAFKDGNGVQVPGNSKIPPFSALSDLNAIIQGKSQTLIAGIPGFGV